MSVHKRELLRDVSGDDFLGQIWLLPPELRVYLVRRRKTAIYVNLNGFDILQQLVDLGFWDEVLAEGIGVTIPHGRGHNCFRFPTDPCDDFLDSLGRFYRDNESTLKAILSDSPEASKSWRGSWWPEEIDPADTKGTASEF